MFYKIFFILLILFIPGIQLKTFGQTTYNTPGSYTYTVPSGVTTLIVECWGGGGGGSTTTSNFRAGGGGGGGAYAKSILTVTPGSNYTVVVGSGGSAGNNGGNSSFGSSVIANGGRGVANNTTIGGSGGTIASSTANIVIYQGGNGGNGGSKSWNLPSGGGGGGAGSNGNGGNASGSTAGLGTSENGGNGGAGVINSNGNNGSNYGAGGSGGSRNNNSPDRIGGTGARGLVVISPCDPISLTCNSATLYTDITNGLINVYSFNESTGTTAHDTEASNDGTLINGPGWSTSGQFGNAVSLDGTDDYVSLPAGIVSGLTDFSISTWVYWNGGNSWQRAFDFGNSSSTGYMFLTPSSGTVVRFAISTTDYNSEEIISGSSALSTGTWHHVAVTLSGNTGTLYVDGSVVGTNTSMTLSPSSLGSTSNNWLGRSQYTGDSYFNGRIDEFRLYNRALSENEITGLYNAGNCVSYDEPETPIVSGGCTTPTLSNNVTYPLSVGTHTITWTASDTYSSDNCSQSVTVENNSSPSIITQPIDPDPIPTENGSCEISVEATGFSLSYQWQLSTDGGSNWSNLPEGTYYSGTQWNNLSITDPIESMNGNKYQCYITSPCGSTYTDIVTISVYSPPTVNFVSSSFTSTNESGNINIEVSLSNSSTNDISIPFTINPSSTSTGGGIDYNISNSPLVISAGATSANIVVTLNNDLLDEDNETIVIDLETPDYGILGTTTNHTITITDDDTPPTVTLSSSTSSIIENGGTSTITATLSAASGRDVTIDLGFTGTATGSGTDYATSASQIVISAGSTTGNVTITGVDDSVYEGANETVIVDITSVTNGTESGTQQETISIIEDESIPTVSLSVNPDVINENGGSSTVTATLSNYTTQNVTVNFSFSGTATGGGTDYTASASQVTINSGSLTNTFTITAVDDASLIGDVTVVIDISGVTNATENGTQQETIIIADDESAPFGSIAVNRSTHSGDTPQELVENILVTGCLTASNITFTGGSEQIGHFTKGTSSFPIDEGIILSTGDVADAEGPNYDYNTTTMIGGEFSDGDGDSDLASIIGTTTEDAAVLEFDFVPAGDMIEFNYIFASEEYAEFINEEYNDAFAFLLSGPGISGTINIALIPGTSTPVAINNVHGQGATLVSGYPAGLESQLNYQTTFGHTYTGGFSGPWTINPTNDASEPPLNSSYYVDNGHFTDRTDGTLTWTNGNGSAEMEYDGRTTLLSASHSVTPCETYHIKIVVADVVDDKWDSGVFLEGRSFTSNEVQISSQIEGISGDADDMYEGCDGSFIRFQRAAGADNTEVLNFPIVLSGTATNGVDYIYTDSGGTIIGDGTFPSSAVLNSGVDYIDYYYKAQSDGTIEGNETVIFKVNNSCPCDVSPTYFEKTVTIIDVPQIVTSTTEVIQCQAAGNPVATITVNMENGLDANDYTFSIDGGTTQSSNIFTITATQPDGSDIVGTSHYVTVSDQYSCNEVTEYNIIIPDIAPFDANAGSDISMCEGQSGIQLEASGGIYYEWTCSPTSGLSYLSSTSISNPSVLSTIPSGTYTFTVTAQDQPGASPACQGTDDMILTVNQAPDISVTADDYAVCDGTAIQLTATVTNGGTSPSYSWNPTTDLSSSTIYNPVYTPSVSSYLSQSFTVTVTGDNGCTANASSSIIEVYPDPVITTSSITNTSCSSSSDGSATVSASSPGTSPTPTFTYQWDAAAGSQTGATATGLAAGSYTVTVTDNTQGCTNTHQVTIGTDPDITAPTAICKDVTVTLDGTGNATITTDDINNGSTDDCTIQSNLILSLDITTFNTSDVGTNTVTLTVEDESGNTDTCTSTVTVNYPATCIISGSTTIWLEDFSSYLNNTTDDTDGNPNDWSTSINDPIRFSVQNGELRANNTDEVVTWLSEPIDSIDISGWTNLNISIDLVSATGIDDGEYIKMEYSVDETEWTTFDNNGDVAGNFSNISSCTSVPDGSLLQIRVSLINSHTNEYYYFDNIHLTGDPDITITPVATDISCNGLTDGSITVNTSGAFTPYQYKLDAVYTSYQSSNVFNNLPAGSYTVTVKGTHSTILIEKSASPVTITEPAADPNLQDLSVSDASSCNPADGNINFTITNSQSGVTYELQTTGGASLSPAVTAVGTGSDLDLTILQANIPGTTTTYQVHATSSTGCSELTLTDQPILTVYNTPAPTGSATQSFCSSDVPRIADISITGSTILWYNASTGGSTLSPTTLLVNGTTYYASQTLNGCESQNRLAVTVIVTSTPTIHTVTHGTVCGTGTATIYATSSTGTIDWYSAQTGGTLLATGTDTYTTPNLSTPGKYSYWVEAVSNGCTTPTRSEVYVNVYTLPAITLGDNPIVCKGSTSTDLTYSGTAGTPNQYAIDFDGTAEGFGFVDVSYTSLPSSPISITVPGGALAGTYNATLTVKNSSNGCISNDYSITIRVVEVTISESITDVTCSGYSNGEIDITVSGGDTPYTFAWTTSDGSGLVPTDEDQTGLEEGTYNVTVTDVNGCQASGSYTVSNVPDTTNPEINFTTPQDSLIIAITTSESATDVSVDFTAFNDGSGARDVNPVATDNCSVLKYTYDQSGATNIDSPLTGINTISTQSFNLGETVISWEATDGSTNTATKTQLVYATRTNQFVVNCAADETLGCNPSTFTKTNPTYTLPTWLTTLIGNGTVTLDTTMTTTLNAASGTECEVTRTRTYSVTFDIIFKGSTIASVTQSCDQTYTYTIDTEDPVASCTTDKTVTVDSGECNYTHSGTSWDATATDNCNVASIAYVLTGATTGSGILLDGVDFNTGTTTVTWTATDDCGNTHDCSYTVTVGENLSISSQPQNESVCEGSNVTFSVTASADSGTPTYQWQVDTGGGFADMSGETSSSLSLTSVTTGMSGYQYQVVITGTCSEDVVTSNAVTLTVNANVAASVSIADSPSGTICAGTSVTFTATPTNGGAGPTYQWYKNSSPLSGETASTYTTTTLADGDQVYVVMTSNADCVTGSPATSNTLTVNASDLALEQLMFIDEVCYGENSGQILVEVTGGSPTYDISILNGSSSEVASYTASLNESHLFENLSPDSYTVNVTDNQGCTLSYSGLINAAEELTITLNDSTNNSCAEDLNGSIDIDVSGGSQGNYFLFDENEGSGTDAGTRIDVAYYNELSIRYSGTLECWVKFRNSPQDYAVFIIKGDTEATEKYSLQLFNKQLCLTLHKGTTGDLSDYTYITGGSSPFPTGEWHHVAGTWDVDAGSGTGNMYLYLDGVQVATTAITTSDLPNTSGSETAPLMIGRQYTNSSEQYFRFDGYIREVRVWDYQRSRIELLSTMYSSLSGSESGLVSYLPIQDGTGTTISNDVTISGANDGIVANGSSDYWETGYQFSWTGPNEFTASTEDISNLSSGQYTVTVTDINNCETTAQYEITTADSTDPVISNCPSDMNVNVDNGLCSAVVSWTIPTATDNCSIDTLTVSSSALETITEPVSGTHQATISVGTSTITYTATDSNGNTATCQFDITVADNEDPVIGSCPANTTVSTLGDVPTAVTVASDIATDNCGLNTISHVDVTSLSCPRTITRTYTVTDIHGNSATCDQVITITNASCIDANLCSTTLGSNLISGSPTSGTGTLYTETISVCASTTYEIKFDVSGTSPFDFDVSLDGDLVNDDDMYNSGSTYGFKFQSSSSASNVVLSLINNDTNSLSISNLSFAHCGPTVSAAISTQPECTGSLAELTATVTGSGSYVYQWQESSNGGSSWSNLSDGANISGATTTTISFTSWTEGNLYRIVVSETSNGLSDENCSIQSNTLSISPSDSDAPVYQEAFKNGIDPVHTGGNYALSACDDATNTFSQLALDATDVIDNCSAFGDLILTYSITNGINDLTNETGDASSYSFPVGSSTVTYQAEDENGNVATFTFTVVISDTPTTTDISTDGTVVTDGSGYRPYQASTHTYTVDGGSATSGSTYTWKVVDKDDTELTAGTASTYSIDTSNPASVIITWGGSIPTSGNDYKIIVRETNSTSGCYTEKELTVTILENTFNATVVDRGDACHTPQSSTTLIDWLINKTGGTNTWYFSYKIFIDNAEINYASEGITPTNVEATGSSFTLNYLYGNVTDAQKTLRLEIYDVYDTYDSPETNTGDNSDEVTLYEKPTIQF